MARAWVDKNYYAVMGLPPEATEEEIRKAYRRLALQWHPDRNPGNTRAGERFREISEAYAVLIDSGKRQAYDRARQSGTTGDFRATQEDLFRDLFADPRASAIFEELAREFQRMGMRVDRQHFHQTLFGGRTVVSGRVIVVTPFTPLTIFRLVRAALRGAAAAGAPAAPPGTRTPGMMTALGRAARWFLGLPARTAVDRPAPGDQDLVLPLRLTHAEAARGGRRRVTLPLAPGPENLVVTVPPGVRRGTKLRLRGKGHRRDDGSRGDLYLAVELDEPR